MYDNEGLVLGLTTWIDRGQDRLVGSSGYKKRDN